MSTPRSPSSLRPYKSNLSIYTDAANSSVVSIPYLVSALFNGKVTLGWWRVVFPTRDDESDEQALSDHGAQQRLQRFFPRAAPYEIVHRNLYKVHQRVAATFRKGRVFLAGDAAHVNNPIGGLGLNCGIHDGIELAERLSSFCNGWSSDDELDLYDRRRRPLNIEFVQSQTINNKQRLEEKDPAVRAAHFAQLRATAADPAQHRQFLLRTSLIDSVRKAALIK
jgi:3-(3-hydroxy-phenyl)propionate hydroxylase